MTKLIPIALSFGMVAGAAELPVKHVVLYKHGVGYFERSGELGPGESAQLDFKASEMNDVLKSLTLATSGDDRVAALRYDASEPTERKLQKFPINIQPGQPLSHLIDQLKGEQLELQFGTDTVTGAIVGARMQKGTDTQPDREQVTLLLQSGELRTVDLSAASSVRFTDEKLQLQLRDYLAVLTGARSQEKRSVYIDSTDSGRRQIGVSYMIPAAVWKSSYRLLFGESGEPTLEGWAIVDNTTGEDWTKVSLALVSGRPISFISRLYEPKYVQRQVAELEEDRPQAPVVYRGAVGVGGAMPKEEGARRDQRLAMAEMAQAPPPPRLAPMAKSMPSSVASTAAGRELGELFEYRFDQPVTVRKNESAMLPFLQQEVTARKLLIYSDQSSQHPLNAAEITNSTGKTLDGGPITVFDAGAYAGEALVETVKAGDKRLISYGIDLGTRVTTLFDSDRARVREIHYRRGVLTALSSMKETRTYTVRNVDQKAKTLIVQHPARPGYKLLDREPDERTADAYRFEVKLDSGAEVKFPVVEERQLSQAYALTNQTPDLLASFVQNKELSAAAREQLQRILDQKRQIADLNREAERLDTQIKEVVNDQGRIRQNISSLNRVSGQQEQVQKYAAQLAEQEGQLAGLRDRLAEVRTQTASLETELNRMVETMEF